MRRLTLLSLIALTGCLKTHNVVTAPAPRAAVAQETTAPAPADRAVTMHGREF